MPLSAIASGETTDPPLRPLRAVHDVAAQLLDVVAGFGPAVDRELLLAHGVPDRLARFAGTHASWQSPEAAVEDLLVSFADKIWKNKRVTDLEDLVVAELSRACGRPVREVFMELDEALTRIGDGADRRLAWQAEHPVAPGRPGGGDR
ncbi:phosphohydrolase [Streptomyces roseirectus]|uniref:Phosphohydrolase n=1 Tax=Streptomyces roseirectus TaxID=2768066 RepID=A0A7H0INT9_9ACTN|nr:phosphohydrolase [Streptomyces roseirectus]QNP74455.1 phosphohydrolase [Streptomyces roseirectus]